MCTISWLADKGGLEVWFNRDESVSRQSALPPSIHAGDRRFIAPVDPEGGGTWLGVTEDGHVLALLNHYQEQRINHTPRRSRGTIIWRLAGAADRAAAWLGIHDQLDGYAPFHLVEIGTEEVTVKTWNGREMIQETEAQNMGMLTTSSWDFPRVRQLRERAFLRIMRELGTEAGDPLERYHEGEGDGGDSHGSVLMDRGERRTVSQQKVMIESGQVSFAYRERWGSGRPAGRWEQCGMPLEI